MMKTHPRTSRPQFCVPGVTLIYVLYRAVGGWRCKNSPTIFAANPDIFFADYYISLFIRTHSCPRGRMFAFSGTLASYKDLVSRGYRLQTTSPGLAYGCISLLSTMDVRTSRLACSITVVTMFKLKGTEGDGVKSAKAPHLEGAAHTASERGL